MLNPAPSHPVRELHQLHPDDAAGGLTRSVRHASQRRHNQRPGRDTTPLQQHPPHSRVLTC